MYRLGVDSKIHEQLSGDTYFEFLPVISLVLSGFFYWFSYPVYFATVCIQGKADRAQGEKNGGWFHSLGNTVVMERKGYLSEFWLLQAPTASSRHCYHHGIACGWPIREYRKEKEKKKKRISTLSLNITSFPSTPWVKLKGFWHSWSVPQYLLPGCQCVEFRLVDTREGKNDNLIHHWFTGTSDSSLLAQSTCYFLFKSSNSGSMHSQL